MAGQRPMDIEVDCVATTSIFRTDLQRCNPGLMLKQDQGGQVSWMMPEGGASFIDAVLCGASKCLDLMAVQ